MRLKVCLLCLAVSSCAGPRKFSRIETCYPDWSQQILKCSDLEEIKDRDAVCLKMDEFAKHEIECRE